MTSAFGRTLPARPDLDQQKKLPKELLRSFRAGDREAIARVRAELPDKRTIVLADAQFVVAREYGFASWRELKEHIERLTIETLPPLERFKRAVDSGDAATWSWSTSCWRSAPIPTGAPTGGPEDFIRCTRRAERWRSA